LPLVITIVFIGVFALFAIFVSVYWVNGSKAETSTKTSTELRRIYA